MPYVNGKWVDPIYQGEPSIGSILAVLGGVVGTPLAIMLIYQGVKYYNILRLTHQAAELVAYGVVALVTTIVASSIVYSIYAAVMSWWDGLFPKYTFDDYKPASTVNNTSNTGYLKAKKPAVYKWNRNTETANIPAGLIAGDRTQPPQAVFFGRLDGLPVAFTGLYEEKYLNTWEKKYWDKQKVKDPALATASESVIPSPALDPIETTTKIVKW